MSNGNAQKICFHSELKDCKATKEFYGKQKMYFFSLRIRLLALPSRKHSRNDNRPKMASVIIILKNLKSQKNRQSYSQKVGNAHQSTSIPRSLQANHPTLSTPLFHLERDTGWMLVYPISALSGCTFCRNETALQVLDLIKTARLKFKTKQKTKNMRVQTHNLRYPLRGL